MRKNQYICTVFTSLVSNIHTPYEESIIILCVITAVEHNSVG